MTSPVSVELPALGYLSRRPRFGATCFQLVARLLGHSTLGTCSRGLVILGTYAPTTTPAEITEPQPGDVGHPIPRIKIHITQRQHHERT